MTPAHTSGASHPGFEPYRRLRDELIGLPAQAWIAACNRLASARGLRSAGGAPLQFIGGDEPQGALGYEAAIFHHGRVACREHGRGAVHDLHNALVWLVFPALKATLNRLHLEFAHGGDDAGDGSRGRVRDRATLLDESGLLWLSSSPGLDARLRARDWRGLLVESRDELAAHVRPVVIGHGLLEKLATPYKSMTAHCLVCACGDASAEVAWDAEDADDAAEAADAARAIDQLAAGCVAAAFAAGEAPRLAPLPILGLPGWDAANHDPSYYEDARVFRD